MNFQQKYKSFEMFHRIEPAFHFGVNISTISFVLFINEFQYKEKIICTLGTSLGGVENFNGHNYFFREAEYFPAF